MFKGLYALILMILAVFSASCDGQAGRNTAVESPGRQVTPAPMTSPTATSPSASPTLQSTPDQPTEGSEGREPAEIVRQYYDAINQHEYRRAYELWSGKGEASKQTFDDFKNGFAETTHVNVNVDENHIEIEGAAGSEYATLPVTIAAQTSDGQRQNYRGKYVLRRSMVDGATAEQRSWRIYSADIQKIA